MTYDLQTRVRSDVSIPLPRTGGSACFPTQSVLSTMNAYLGISDVSILRSVRMVISFRAGSIVIKTRLDNDLSLMSYAIAHNVRGRLMGVGAFLASFVGLGGSDSLARFAAAALWWNAPRIV